MTENGSYFTGALAGTNHKGILSSSEQKESYPF
jgi:hypothetical protein